jgi:hypothetical protein
MMASAQNAKPWQWSDLVTIANLQAARLAA